MQCMRGKGQTIRIYGRAVSFDLNRAAKNDTLGLLLACGTSRRQASTVAMRRQRSPCIQVAEVRSDIDPKASFLCTKYLTGAGFRKHFLDSEVLIVTSEC
ncbi:hypothetical protein TWF225_009022 [Orbilia oligospora]|nr:hypothetical protein TWF225_009022 [Orbilia oligospora]KAF3234572.1 hypothetical protein TWF128_002307 [Orbilia oligospora]KAF3248683.1 hypothetical protein TWF217_009042 [Orbilia oligospora]